MTSIERAPDRLSDLKQAGADVRIQCEQCGFEEDWTCAGLADHLARTGGSELWTEITRHLRCRHFGCGSTNLHATAVPRDRRQANIPRRIGRFDAHLLSTALGVLDAAARRSRGQVAATLEVRLALLVVHRYARDRDCVRSFWSRASIGNRNADEGLIEPLQVIRQRLVTKGWLAPSFLIDPERIWPWDAPAPPGWLQADRRGGAAAFEK